MHEIMKEVVEKAANPLSLETQYECVASIKQNRIEATQRERLLDVAAYAIQTVAEIDAEAETTQFREQARVLLVAGHAVGYKYLTVWSEPMARITLEDEFGGASRFTIDLLPESEITDAALSVLARVLQERKGAG